MSVINLIDNNEVFNATENSIENNNVLTLEDHIENLEIEFEINKNTSNANNKPSTLTIVNEDNQELLKRDRLKFKGINVEDDGIDSTIAEINVLTNEDIDELFERI